MIKKLKVLWLKWKWVLFGKKTFKQANYEINKERAAHLIKPKKRFKISNANYASTKRSKKI
jgi:hypothetical protein